MDRFLFENLKLQEQLRRLYEAAGIVHDVDGDGALICDDSYAAAVESLQSAVRYGRFPGWHTACIPFAAKETSAEDRQYLKALFDHLHDQVIPFEIEEHNGERWLLLPEEAVIPDKLWESIYGPVSTFSPISPKCCFCEREIGSEGFAEISARRAGGAFRSVLYAHAECLASRVHPEALHVLETLE